jgi:uroporphyrinogen-III decarboxylase
MDHESQCEELFEIHTEKVLEMARQAAQSPALCFILMDNLDSNFYSPPLFRRLNLRFHQRVADVLHSAGKLLFSHACGQLWGLRDLIAEANLDGMESISHAPLGDLPLADAKKIHSKFIVNGGMTVHEMGVTEDRRESIRQYVKSLFLEMRPFDRFIFASACNTAVGTPWDNLLAFRDACWEFGTSDH